MSEAQTITRKQQFVAIERTLSGAAALRRQADAEMLRRLAAAKAARA